jgi:hypothetical protein
VVQSLQAPPKGPLASVRVCAERLLVFSLLPLLYTLFCNHTTIQMLVFPSAPLHCFPHHFNNVLATIPVLSIPSWNLFQRLFKVFPDSVATHSIPISCTMHSDFILFRFGTESTHSSSISVYPGFHEYPLPKARNERGMSAGIMEARGFW